MEAKYKAYTEKNQVLYYLDLGMLNHWAGQYQESNALLSLAENRIEELYTESISKNILAGVLNDNSLAYTGEDYEDIYLNVFKALNYIALNQHESALVEIRRANIKMNLLEDKYKQLIDTHNESAEIRLDYPKNVFHNSALARYIGALLYRTEGSIDDAKIDVRFMDEAWNAQKQIYHFPKPPSPSLEKTGKARVNVLCFSGLAPIKLPETVYFATGQDSIFITQKSQNEDYSESLSDFNSMIIPGLAPGGLLKLEFPKMESRPSPVDKVVIKLNGQEENHLYMLEDLQQIVRKSFESKKNLIISKTILRATIKFITSQGGAAIISEALSGNDPGTGNFLGSLFSILGSVAMETTENADLRISHFFPAHAWVSEFTVEPGTYQVELEYRNGDKLISSVDLGQMEFRKDKLNFIENYMLK